MLEKKPRESAIPFERITILPDGKECRKTFWVTNWNKVLSAEVTVRLRHGF
jgi:hypothetical protein